MALVVLVDNRQTDLSIDLACVSFVIEAVLKLEAKQADELSVLFLPLEEMGQMHAQFFNDPEPTDCMSFPLTHEKKDSYQALGDIVVCPKVAIDYVQKHGGDVYQETTLYLVHGLLHLIGYDDIEQSDKVQMRRAENRQMEYLIKEGLLLKRGR